MQEPAQTIIVYWADAPPPALIRVAEMHFRDAGRRQQWIWWRGRWCVVADEVMAQVDFGEIDRKLAAGELGLLWERV